MIQYLSNLFGIDVRSFLELYNNLWGLFDSLIMILVVIIFFLDPVRRWNFFGYRPTAITVLYEPISGKVLLSKINGAWSFNQGGMYEENIYVNCKDVLKRELGLAENRFKLVYTKPMGTVRIREKSIIQRARLSTISMFSSLRGKGYMACFLRSKFEGIEPEIKMGAGVQEIKICTIEEAREFVTQHTIGEHSPQKQKIILTILDEIGNYCKGVREWETQNLDQKKLQEEVSKLQGEKKPELPEGTK